MNKPYRRDHSTARGKIIFYAFMAVLFLFFLLRSFAPSHTLKEFKNAAVGNPGFIKEFDSTFNHPSLLEAVKENAYLEALVELAASDSIQLAVNLSDSTADLYLHGVRIHQSKLQEIRKDRFFNKLAAMEVEKIFSSPLSASKQYATIVKEPIVVRHAPKDTIEAALNAWQPDTLVQKPAFLLLSLEHGIDLVLEQAENNVFRDRYRHFIFHSRIQISNTGQALFRFISFRPQEYRPRITVKLDVDELRSIYRALPTSAMVVVRP